MVFTVNAITKECYMTIPDLNGAIIEIIDTAKVTVQSRNIVVLFNKRAGMFYQDLKLECRESFSVNKIPKKPYPVYKILTESIHLINYSRDVTSVGEIQRSFLFSFE